MIEARYVNNSRRFKHILWRMKIVPKKNLKNVIYRMASDLIKCYIKYDRKSMTEDKSHFGFRIKQIEKEE